MFTEAAGLVHVSPQASRNRLEQRPGSRRSSLEPGGLGVETSVVGGPGYACDGFIRAFSPGPTFDVTSSREIIYSLSLTRKTDTVCILRHV